MGFARASHDTSLLTEVLGEGPSALVTDQIPDKHHCRGSFGGPHVILLWRDAEATGPNVTPGVLEFLTNTFWRDVTPEDLLAYTYALKASLEYVGRF